MGSQTSLKTSQRGGCNPLNPLPLDPPLLLPLSFGRHLWCDKGLIKKRISRYAGEIVKTVCHVYLTNAKATRMVPLLSLVILQDAACGWMNFDERWV